MGLSDQPFDITCPDCGGQLKIDPVSRGVIAHTPALRKKTFEDFGEYTVESMPPPAVSDIPSLQAHVVPEFSGFELTTPDVYRAQVFNNHLATYEAKGAMPNLITLTLPNGPSSTYTLSFPSAATGIPSDWYVVTAVGDENGDSVPTVVVGTTFTNDLEVANEGD